MGLPGFNYFHETKKLISLHTIGLQVNLLLRDDFDKWNDHKIELLHMIDTFRNRLSRLGLLSDANGKQPGKKEEPLIPRGADEKDWCETIKNLLDAASFVSHRTQISFFVYKMDGLEEFYRNIDEVNIRMFYQRCI